MRNRSRCRRLGDGAARSARELTADGLDPLVALDVALGRNQIHAALGGDREETRQLGLGVVRLGSAAAHCRKFNRRNGGSVIALLVVGKRRGRQDEPAIFPALVASA